MLRHLREHGHQAMVLAPGDPPPTCEGAPVVALPSVPLPGYPQVRLPVATAGTLAAPLARFRPDVIHLASPFTLGGPALRAAERLGVPVVAVYQTDVAGFASRYGAGSVTGMAWHRIRSIHERADVTLAPSRWAASDLARHGIPRIELWPRGVDTHAFSPVHRDAALHHRLAPDGQVVVGFLGRLAAEKQVEDLRVLSGRDGIRLVVIGDGPERERLRRVLPDAVFTGMLSGPHLSRAVATLDVAVHPGPHETFCQSVQEAMAGGVPVVAVAAGAAAELVDHSRTGWLYAADDLTGLRERVLDLAGDDAKRRAMGAAARASVQGRTWDAVGEQLLAHYRAVRSTSSLR
ncbi:MAG TPA: glycosyltransferase family 1 protein [Ornithinibacter sp.]|nr:glycosyltransferase family 1 protein [Ornithinibacter sp.]